jgi:hypothetical protein
MYQGGISPLFRGRLNGKDQVPAGKKTQQRFDFATRMAIPRDDVLYDQQDQTSRTKSGGRQRRPTSGVLDLDGLEDIRLQETVEGEDIRQVLMGTSHPRGGRVILSRSTEYALEGEHPHEVVAGRSAAMLTEERLDQVGYSREDAHEEKAVDDKNGQNSPTTSSWTTLLQWVGWLLIGISILLTWPVAVAYLRA